MEKPAFQSLIHLLEHRAAATPGQVAFEFADEPCTYADLWRALDLFAACLVRHGVRPGDHVVLCLPNGGEFFAALYGAQRAGATPAPIATESGPERVLAIAGLCGARAVVMPSATPAARLDAFRALCEPRSLPVVTVLESRDDSTARDFPVVKADDVALVQYTSGSTGDPKGVQLTHAAILTNLRQMQLGMEITAKEVFVTWLPLHHDMGLILTTMMPFLVGARLILLPVRQASTRHWFEAIERHRGTYTAAPDFSYRLCLGNIDRLKKYDLSSLRIVLNAAEPVRAGTVKAFEEAFGLEHVMRPAYGLAEVAVGVSMWPPDGKAVKVDDHGFVSVGPGFPGVELAIRDENGDCAPGTVGEIAVRSPSATRGYLNNPEATAELFWPDGYFRTGDLGYLDADGDLFVVGRSKNIIIQAGRNIAPQEVEEAVDALPCVRRSAAVGIDRRRVEGEQLYVFAEARGPRDAPAEAFEAMTRDIVQAVNSHLGLRPARVYLLGHGAIPRTDTGKTRYGHLGEQYRSGALRAAGHILFPDY